MGHFSWLGLVLVWGIGVGCSEPALDWAGRASAPPPVTLEPEADPSSVSEVFRARIAGAEQRARPWLFRDEVSAYYERALRRGELPGALLERAVPLRYWRSGNDWLVQPLDWLEQGESYALALEGYGSLVTLRVSEQPSARATRWFPGPGRPQRRFSVLCGLPLADTPRPVTLEPGAIPAVLATRPLGSGSDTCLSLTVERAFDEPVLAPPLLGGLLLEPSPFLPDAPEPSLTAPCPSGDELGGACLDVEDDRIYITPRAQDALWLLSAPQRVAVSANVGQRVALLVGLTPASELELRGEVITASAARAALTRRITTGSQRRHLVLNEVLSNALGPEPGSEWIELGNDSELPASLAGLWLEDAGGHVALPDVVLAPGELVVLVGPLFRASGVDVPVPAEVRQLELASLGQRGLGNAGEALLLVGHEGIVSRFPALAASHAGRSMARRTLATADDDPAGFAEHGEPGASPGAANHFE